MKCKSVSLLLLFLIFSSFANLIYSKVQINFSTVEDLKVLSLYQLPIDDLHIISEKCAEIVLSESDVKLLKKTGLSFEILIPDMTRDYLQRSKRSSFDSSRAAEICFENEISSFPYGTIGGYLRLAEQKAFLDSLQKEYPTLMSPLKSIGKTHEDRDIWSYKLSDNVDSDESSTEKAAYYDAKHHCREMNSSPALLFFTIWLLENYEKNPMATHILKNRELYFVPTVNPDGVAFNELNSPNGGGMWRKNKRINGDFSFGVDLNRNYSHGWGLDNGSSGNGNSDTYRGPSEFSEPETQAVRDFIKEIKPVTANIIHTKAGRYLIPYTYSDETPEYETYAELTIGSAENNNYFYGNCKQILDYYSSGTTIDYLHAEGIYCWLPELRGSSFWDPQNMILPVAAENLPFNQMIALAAGSYPVFHSFSMGENSNKGAKKIELNINIKNRGFGEESNNVVVALSPLTEGVTVSNKETTIPSIKTRETQTATVTVNYGELTSTPQLISLEVQVKDLGTTISTDTLIFPSGKVTTLFADGGEEGLAQWSATPEAGAWDTTSLTFSNGGVGFTDTRNKNCPNNFNARLTMSEPISLKDVKNPYLSFSAKWSSEVNFDGTLLQISSDNGSTWQSLQTKHMGTVDGQKGYCGNNDWITEVIDLSSYKGSSIVISFRSKTNYKTSGDGFFFDDFLIADYEDFTTLVSADAPSNKQWQVHQRGRSLELTGYKADQGDVLFRLQNIKGQIILQKSVDLKSSGVIHINNSIAAGMYMANIKIGSKQLSYPIVLQ